MPSSVAKAGDVGVALGDGAALAFPGPGEAGGEPRLRPRGFGVGEPVGAAVGAELGIGALLGSGVAAGALCNGAGVPLGTGGGGGACARAPVEGPRATADAAASVANASDGT